MGKRIWQPLETGIGLFIIEMGESSKVRYKLV